MIKRKNMIMLAMAFVVLMIMYQYSIGEAKGNEPLQEIRTMAHVLQENGASIQQWTIYTREYAQVIENDSAFLKKANELKKKFPAFRWVMESDQHVQKVTGTYEHSSMQEKIQLVTTVANEKPQTYILYELKGFGWSEQVWEKISSTIRQKSSKLFMKQPVFFSCVKGEFNDKMEGVLLKQAYHLLHEFNATPVEALKEGTFVSVSAYTGQWENVLPTKTHPMNIQLALRQTGLGGQTTVVVGTPIITIEY
ncbi:YwmB family TATA-box binding protein [Anoxybacillus rupiensis]|uniref:YwmB family TATA-box binding protein n=1 Tax=Anoxybacteroides rupiense TaxID=311460 RepID=A0ABT5W830_9BACL|nr:YwmB family TATA-box binding protein [Anoxybacillus rupiensis]MBS2771320.1 YwmB family TATA-box binding protein [Anoxybacillus rupiensis]MDE8564745.1 YwmB family TATA-box binding protein [Anoxybacillus rupiensis]